MEPSQAKLNWQPARPAPWNTTPQTDLGKAGCFTRLRTTWATVTAATPLRVRLDGRTAPLDITPDTLAAGLTVGDRVLVLIQGRSLVILGKAA